MIPSGALAGLVRRGTRLSQPLAALACFAAFLTPSLAGDNAEIDIIGYSADFRTFAFEQFGIEDGSGFPYSEIFIVDLPSDSWVKGSPVKAVGQEEPLLLNPVRVKALSDGQSLLAPIVEPARFLAMTGDGALDNDGQSLRFGIPGYGGPGAMLGEYELVIEQTQAPPLPDCPVTDQPIMKFALTLKTADGQTPDKEIYRDQQLPKSRSCALNYRIYGVAGPRSYEFKDLVAIISVFTVGFEGPNRRFIAIPIDGAS